MNRNDALSGAEEYGDAGKTPLNELVSILQELHNSIQLLLLCCEADYSIKAVFSIQKAIDR